MKIINVKMTKESLLFTFGTRVLKHGILNPEIDPHTEARFYEKKCRVAKLEKKDVREYHWDSAYAISQIEEGETIYDVFSVDEYSYIHLAYVTVKDPLLLDLAEGKTLQVTKERLIAAFGNQAELLVGETYHVRATDDRYSEYEILDQNNIVRVLEDSAIARREAAV